MPSGKVGCDVPGCANRARWVPIIVVRPNERHEPSEALRVPAKVTVCNPCKHAIVFEDFLSAGFQEVIDAETRRKGMAPPDWSRTTLDWKDAAALDEVLGPGH